MQRPGARASNSPLERLARAPDTFRPAEWPMYYLLTIERQHMRNASLLLEPHGLLHREWRILAQINEHHDMSVGNVAEFAGMERSTASKMIDALERRGLLRRVTADHDRRRNRVMLSAVGRRKFEETAPLVAGLFRLYFADLPLSRLHALMSMLHDLKSRVARTDPRLVRSLGGLQPSLHHSTKSRPAKPPRKTGGPS